MSLGLLSLVQEDALQVDEELDVLDCPPQDV